MLLLHTSCFILTIALVQSYNTNLHQRTRRDDDSRMLFPDDKHIYTAEDQDAVSLVF